MNNLTSRLAWLKKKELGLPIGVWVAIVAVVLFYFWRRHQAGSSTSSSSSTNPNGADALGNAPTSGGASDASGAMEALANEVALETQLLTNVLDKLQGKKHKKTKPHRRKHHPKHAKAPTTHKTPVANHPKRKHRRVKPKHRRSGVSSGGGGKPTLSAIKAVTDTSVTLKVRPGGITKPISGGRFPIHHPQPELAHPRGELHPGTEHEPEVTPPSFTRGPTTVAKRNPQAADQRTQEIEHRHPAMTKPRKH